MDIEWTRQITEGRGFIAALDQSGEFAPRALRLYDIDEGQYSNENEMFDLVHQIRTRIITSPSFNSKQIIGTILFEQTMDRDVEGIPTAQYLWEEEDTAPFLKADKGLADRKNDVQLMKSYSSLDELLEHGVARGIFGTRVRSFIAETNEGGIKANIAQQFEFGKQVLSRGLVPILEPKVDINATDKAEAEDIVLRELLADLDDLADDRKIIIKVFIPTKGGLYKLLIEHPKVTRIAALSGGYERKDANEHLSRNHGMIASFSRALSEGLSTRQSDEEFNATMVESVKGIYRASIS